MASAGERNGRQSWESVENVLDETRSRAWRNFLALRSYSDESRKSRTKRLSYRDFERFDFREIQIQICTSKDESGLSVFVKGFRTWPRESVLFKGPTQGRSTCFGSKFQRFQKRFSTK